MLLMKDPIQAVKTAMALAEHAHEGQVDKQGEPYYWHVLRVGLSGATTEEKIVGLLHDTIEDLTFLDLEVILDFFGPEIADAVEAISRRDNETYEEFILRVKTNTLATKVKLRDISDNVARMNRLPNETINRLLPRYQKARAMLDPSLSDYR